MTIMTFADQIPEFIRLLEVCLRSGYSIAQSLEIVARDTPKPLAEDARALHAALLDGTPLPTVLANWLRQRPEPDLDLVAATIALQLEIGGNLADKLQLLGQILARRQLV